MAQKLVDSVKSSIAQNLGVPGGHALAGDKNFSLEQVPDLTGKVAVVTGGSEGIGYGCTHTLLSHNISRVFILSPSKEVIDGATKEIGSELGEDIAKRVTWIQCDLANWPEVASVARKITEQTDRLDILINNAGRGIMTYQLTEYGVDRHMAINHMGSTILTSHLLDLMKRTASTSSTPVRIVNLASNAHQMAPEDTKFASLDELNQDLGPNPQYGRSKLATLLYARWLNVHVTQKGHPNLLANAVHPGVVTTKMSQDDIHEPYPLAGYGLSVALKPFKKSQWEGCVSSMYAATVTEKSGQYICPPAWPENGSELSNDMALADQLMLLTKEIVREKTKPQSQEKGCPFKMD